MRACLLQRAVSTSLAALAALVFFGVAACGASHASGKAGDGPASARADAPGVSGSRPVVAAPRCALPPEPSPLLANGVALTDAGAVRGVLAGATYSFKGVPYAAPPVGELRWHAPQAAPCFSSDGQAVRDASSFANACIQVTPSGKKIGGDEDCLYLNVWTPAKASGAPLPVMVFFHGGFFFQGSASDQDKSGAYKYDGAYLAEHGGAVVVTVDSRLGALGYFAGHDWGLRDQIAALAWVKTNIGAFAGDAARVMIFGQGAGASSVAALLVSPAAKGLFSRALLESGSGAARSAANAVAASGLLADKLGCGGDGREACLRAKDATTVATALPPIDAGGARFGLAVDGDVLTDAPEKLLALGRFSHVPVIVGTNQDDASSILPLDFNELPIDTDVLLAKEAHTFLDARYAPAQVTAILAKYPPADFASPEKALIALATDRAQTCYWRRLLRALDAGQSEPVLRYVYTHTDSGGLDTQYGAGNMSELKLVWRNFGRSFQPTASELAMSDAVIGYWSRFAATGNPNGDGAPAWPVYDAADSYLRIDDRIEASSGERAGACDFWDTVDALPH